MVILLTSIVDFHKARLLIHSSLKKTDSETLPISDVYARYIAKTLVASINIPFSDISAIDGYALYAQDTLKASVSEPISLSVLSENSSSDISNLLPSTAARVVRGSIIPIGANAVIPLKDTFKSNSGVELMVMSELSEGYNILSAGSIIRKDQQLAKRNDFIDVKTLKKIAESGISKVSVVGIPKIKIFTIGSDLLEITDSLKNKMRFNALKYEIAGYTYENNCRVDFTDNCSGRIILEEELSKDMNCDMAIIGVSSSERYEAALEGVKKVGELIFSRVNLQPCSAAAFGKINGTPVFVVSENYVSETFEALIRPALQDMQDRPSIQRPTIQAKLMQSLKIDINSIGYIKAFTTQENNETTTIPITNSLAYNSLIITKSNNSIIKRGEIVDVIFIGENRI